MKKTIFSAAAVLATAAAFATPVDSANTFGILKVTPGNTNTVISVPWEAVGGGSIAVSNIVMTTGMTAGATLFAYDSKDKRYYTWTLLTDGGEWDPVATYVAGSTTNNATKTSEDGRLARGGAFILTRVPADIEKPIYLYGQYNSTSAGEKDITPAASAGGVSYTLFAPPSTTDVHLNDLTFTGEINNEDMIVLDFGKQFKYNASENKWGEVTTTTYDDFTVKTIDTKKDTIDAGLGAWYIRRGTGKLSVQF